MYTPAKDYASTKDTLDSAKEKVANETSRTIEDLKQRASNIRGVLHDASCAVEKAAHRASDEARDIAKNASTKLSDGVDTVTERVRSNPVQSAFIALAVGFFGAMLYRRR